VNLGLFITFFIFYTFGRTPWTGDQQGRYLRTERNKCTQTTKPGVVFERTTPALKRAKIRHALDHAATVIGFTIPTQLNSLVQPDNFTHEVLQL
jgi:hypothetical protein